MKPEITPEQKDAWIKFKNLNGDYKSKLTFQVILSRADFIVKPTEARLIRLFSMQDKGTAINCFLDLQEEFQQCLINKK